MKPTEEEVERLAREMCRLDGFDPDETNEDRGLCGTLFRTPVWAMDYEHRARTYLLARAAERSLALGELAKADGELIASMTAEDAAREAEIARAIRSIKPWYPDDDPRWQEFTPGDPMPCDPDTIVHVLVREDRWSKTWSESEAHPAKHWDWRLGARWLNWGLGSYKAERRAIVAWRPA